VYSVRSTSGLELRDSVLQPGGRSGNFGDRDVALAEGNALRTTARIVQVDKDTVCAWTHRVACHYRTVMLYFWHGLPVSACRPPDLAWLY